METMQLTQTGPGLKTSATGMGGATPKAGALILIAEDEPEIYDILNAYMCRDGLRCVPAADGTAALQMHLAMKPDLVLLDVRMPRTDGWLVLAEIRRRGCTPVIMLTARDQDIDKLSALRMGADDYVVKPFNPSEVVARALAVLRRTTAAPEVRRVRCGSVCVDLEAFEASVETAPGTFTRLPLTLTEFRLLAHMARNPCRVASRGELVTACLPDGEALERTVDSHVSKLRRKLQEAGLGQALSNVRGVGYRLDGVG